MTEHLDHRGRPGMRRLDSGLRPASGRIPGHGQPVVARIAVVLVALAAGALVIAGIRAGAGTIGPVFLALVLTIAGIRPMPGPRRHGWPAWAAVLLSLALVYVLLFGLSFAVVTALGQFATLLPTYAAQAQDTVTGLTAQLERFGVGTTAQERIAGAFDINALTDFVLDLLANVAALSSSLVLVVTLLLFMAIDASMFPTLLATARRLHSDLADALTAFATGTRRYLVVSTVFGLIVAVIDTVILWLAGVPAPITWGLLAFITNYIPNVGFVIGLVPPAILALLEGGPGLMLLVIALYCVVNFVIQSIIQPKIVGDSVGLSGTVTMFSLVFWATVLGALGALLAIPLTLLVKALLVEADPRARWLLPILAGKPRQPAET